MQSRGFPRGLSVRLSRSGRRNSTSLDSFPSMLPFFDQDHTALRRGTEWVGEKLVTCTAKRAVNRAALSKLVADLAAAGYSCSMQCRKSSAAFASESGARPVHSREELARGDAIAGIRCLRCRLWAVFQSLLPVVSHKNELPAKVTSGAAIAAFAITEPEAGSDMASMQTHRRPPGRHNFCSTEPSDLFPMRESRTFTLSSHRHSRTKKLRA